MIVLEESPINPNSSPFSARRFGDEAEFVVARNGGRMDLNKFPVGIPHSLQEKPAIGSPCAKRGVGRFFKDEAGTSRPKDHGIGFQHLKLAVVKVHDDDAARTPLIIAAQAEGTRDSQIFRRVPCTSYRADLLIECIEKLLARRSPAKSGPVIERPAKAAEIERPFRRTVERAAEPVHHPNNPGAARHISRTGGWSAKKSPALDRVIGVDDKENLLPL